MTGEPINPVMKLRYSGEPIAAPAEILLANPGKASVLANGVEREVPDSVAKELVKRDGWAPARKEKE